MDRLGIWRDSIKFKKVNIIKKFRMGNHVIDLTRVYNGIPMGSFTNNRHSFARVGGFKIPNSIKRGYLNR